jgi:dephospho-CoA kinase
VCPPPRAISNHPRTRAGTKARRRPLAVAITGGIGAGKSEILRAFARHGAATISSDDIVHELLRTDDDVRGEIAGRWGTSVLGADGEIDRGKIARIVFADAEELAWLEALLHPRVSGVYMRWRDELAKLDEPPAVTATEVPLLYEVGGEERFDAVVAVTASPQVRVGRRLPPLDDRDRRLLPDEEKLARADYAFVNDGSLEELDAFVAATMADLTA